MSFFPNVVKWKRTIDDNKEERANALSSFAAYRQCCAVVLDCPRFSETRRGSFSLSALPEFLSTPSSRRATQSRKGAGQNSLSIHALRTKGDLESSFYKAHQSPISTHALLTEGDCQCFLCGRYGGFISTHALRTEGDVWGVINLLEGYGFLSTPSTERATEIYNRSKSQSTNSCSLSARQQPPFRRKHPRGLGAGSACQPKASDLRENVNLQLSEANNAFGRGIMPPSRWRRRPDGA